MSNMEEHVQLYRTSRNDHHKSNDLEVDYCTASNTIALRCKVWVHLDRESLQSFIALLQHAGDHHIKQDKPSPQDDRDNEPPDGAA